MKTLPMRQRPLGAASPADRRLRAVAASLLRASSRGLDALAHRLAGAAPAAAGAADPLVEFHAEAGAPEGALYVDGRLVGRLLGVNRL